MKKTAMRLGLSVALFGFGIWSGTQLVSNADGETVIPGSADDPVVTKSYVDKLVGGGTGDAQKQLQAMIDQFKAELEKQQQQSGAKSEVVLVRQGQTLLAEAGAQFVLRAGKGLAFSSDVNGISDVTAGTDIKSGEPVPNNHLIIFPRDGRGVTPDSGTTTLTVLVIGGYTLK